MVVTVRPVAAEIGVWHERTALPSRCTVQAPHCPMPQPNLVPVRPIESRRTQRSGVSAATVTVCDRPLTRMVNDGMGFGLRCDVCVLVYGRCAVNATGLGGWARYRGRPCRAAAPVFDYWETRRTRARRAGFPGAMARGQHDHRRL